MSGHIISTLPIVGNVLPLESELPLAAGEMGVPNYGSIGISVQNQFEIRGVLVLGSQIYLGENWNLSEHFPQKRATLHQFPVTSTLISPALSRRKTHL